MSLDEHVPASCRPLLELSGTELRSAIPALAKDADRMADVRRAVAEIPSTHRVELDDARDLELDRADLVVTSPPYFDLKEYGDAARGQLGALESYRSFVDELADVWARCFDLLTTGGRLCVVVGDVLRSRSEHGRHRLLPLHADIIRSCRSVGFDVVAPIVWYKIGNATIESGDHARFLGKPYEPGACVKNDVEYILLFRKPGGYRSPSTAARILSAIDVESHRRLFTQVWADVGGASSTDHPAPFPVELAERLVRMFSFAGDVVVDPFAGSGTTAIAASRWGRDSVSVEIEPEYAALIRDRLDDVGVNAVVGAQGVGA